MVAFLIIAFGTFLAACKKNGGNSTHTSPVLNTIVGDWELRQTVGSFYPGGANYPPGNGHLLEFTADAYSRYAGGQLQKTGPYSIVADSTVLTSVCLTLPSGEFTSRIVYDNNDSTTKQFFQVGNDTLTIAGGCFAYDAGQMSVYVRVSVLN